MLTDIRPGKPRKTLAGKPIGPLAAFLVGIGALPVIAGTARFLGVNKDSNEAREKLASDLLDAKLRREEAEIGRIQAQTRTILEPPPPPGTPLAQEKAEAFRTLLPLDLAKREVDIEQENQAIQFAADLFPAIREEKRAAGEFLRERARAKAAETAEFLDTAGARREREETETGVLDAQEERLRLQTDLLARAGDPFLPESSRIAALQALTGRVVAPKPRLRPTQRFRLT